MFFFLCVAEKHETYDEEVRDDIYIQTFCCALCFPSSTLVVLFAVLVFLSGHCSRRCRRGSGLLRLRRTHLQVSGVSVVVVDARGLPCSA